MDARMTALETRLDTILPTLATKADISMLESKMVKWVAGIGIATVTVIVSVLGFLFSRIDLPAPQATPIIVTIPGVIPGVTAGGPVAPAGAAQGSLPTK